VSPEVTERLLVLHEAYLEAPPPDDPEPADGAAMTAAGAAHGADLAAPADVSELAGDDRIRVERRAPDIGE
jgi:hypothetical protein